MDHMTAKVSCFARAYHYKVNMEKGGAVFSDTVAEQLLGADYEEISKNMMQGIPYSDGTNWGVDEGRIDAFL